MKMSTVFTLFLNDVYDFKRILNIPHTQNHLYFLNGKMMINNIKRLSLRILFELTKYLEKPIFLGNKWMFHFSL